MSLMHQALDRPAAQSQRRTSGYNPLKRPGHQSQSAWWIIAAAAMLVALAVLAWSQWRPATNPILPAIAQAAPIAATALAEPSATTNPGDTLPAEPGPTATPISPVATDTAIATPVLPEKPEPLPAETSITEAPVATAELRGEAIETSNTANRSTPEHITPVPVEPAREPSIPDSAEELPARADNPPETTPVVTRVVAERPSVSSVASAAPQHAAKRQAIQTAIARGDLALAQQHLQSWITREPQLEEPRIWLAKVTLSQGGAEQAESLLIGLQSNEALGLRGLILEKTGRYSDAARVFEALTREEAGNPQWWLHWAINLENSGRLAEARLLYQTYLEQFSGHNARLTAFATERYRALAG
ncbi:tetratricopeptide repeat protein [Saccharospirillum impatiens]|uniref:tetratricopeptide repeat protein n=1 Tax=Saccharospirillum impatiens TaxID=169438 RepID=UPI000400C1B8|nr:tetratricopeptide repeat protein [Saccharospirillum impatiens]